VAMGCNVFSYSINPFALEMGGRNQNTQLLRSGWVNGPAGRAAAFPTSPNEASEAGLLIALPPKTPSFADFSAVGVFAAAPKVASNGFPGDLGVLAEPNEANAPEPRAKALDAAPIGDARLPPGVVTELSECFPCDVLSPPNRLTEGLRPDGLSWPEPVERESLLELPQGVLELGRRTTMGWRNLTHLARRLHRLSMKTSETVTRRGSKLSRESEAVGQSTGNTKDGRRRRNH
jgi:hypothetical protein